LFHPDVTPLINIDNHYRHLYIKGLYTFCQWKITEVSNREHLLGYSRFSIVKYVKMEYMI